MHSSVKPMFLQTTFANVVFAWFGILGNGAVVVAAGYSLATSDVALAWQHVALCILGGLFLLDLFSGLVHWFSDTWLDERTPGFQRMFSIAREHHLHPRNITGYAARDLVAYSSWPAFVLLGPVVLALGLQGPPALPACFVQMTCATVCLGMFCGSHCHMLAHRHTDSRVVWFLRRIRFLVSPAYHRVHHSGRHDIRYAVVNGWSNPICDRLGIWRALEALVQTLTGATPRRSDLLWRESETGIRLTTCCAVREVSQTPSSDRAPRADRETPRAAPRSRPGW